MKLAGTYPLRWGISVSAAFQSLAGRPLGLTTDDRQQDQRPRLRRHRQPGRHQLPDHSAPRAIRPTARRRARPAQLVAPTLTSASVTVPLVAPGTEFLPRSTSSISASRRRFQVGGYRLQGQIDVFNVFNQNYATAYRSTNFATTAYLQPSSVLQGRMIRLGVQVKW